MLSHLVTVCLALLPFVQCIQIHKHMTQEEVRQTFQTGHDNVPDYEVVRIYHTLHKRDVKDNSSRTVKVNAFNRSLSLYLEPHEGLFARELTLVYTVREDLKQPEGLKYTLQPHALFNVGLAYQNVSKRSAIIAYEGEDGETLVQGNLLEDLSVGPLPHRLHDIILRETREFEDSVSDEVDGETDFRRSHHHVVFKRREPDINANHDEAVKLERRSSETTVDDRSRRSIPSIVYPKILVIVDFSLYIALGNDVMKAAQYILAFWNAVDLRYRLLKNPIIRLNIGGIIISLEPRGTPYVQTHTSNSIEIDGDQAMAAMSRYFYEHVTLPFVTYDMAVAMTDLELCRMEDGYCNSMRVGITYWRGACFRSNDTRTTNAVVLIEDNGGYKGIKTAAQEFAHLMGAPHDEIPETNCPDEGGYIMSHRQIYRENRFEWSKCSLKYLYDFLSSPESNCLRDKPIVGQPLARLLPGQLMTADEQCQKCIPGSRACNPVQAIVLANLKIDEEKTWIRRKIPGLLQYGPRICTALKCVEPEIKGCRTRFAAAEGTSCGVEMYCINGYCVSKKAKHVPTNRARIINVFHEQNEILLKSRTTWRTKQNGNNWNSW